MEVLALVSTGKEGGKGLKALASRGLAGRLTAVTQGIEIEFR